MVQMKMSGEECSLCGRTITGTSGNDGKATYCFPGCWVQAVSSENEENDE